jgi:pimeloyl-ACP methyl ester carboxylesterase
MECQVRDITIHYEEMGSGRPLLLLHGWACDNRHMIHAFEPLFTERSDWRRIYPDLPGMGKSRAADWITQQDQMLELVIAFMDTVAPGERFVVAGTSYGGYLARGLVYLRGEQLDGLLLTVPAVEPDAAKLHLPYFFTVHEDADFLAALTADEQYMRELFVVQSMEVLAKFRQVFSAAFAIADPALAQRLQQKFSFDVNALPSPFPAPTLFLAGRQDNKCGYREAYQLLDSYPRASFVLLDRAGHVLELEQKTLFRAVVNEWLNRVEEYGG